MKLSEWFIEKFGGSYIDVNQYGVQEILQKVRDLEHDLAIREKALYLVCTEYYSHCLQGLDERGTASYWISQAEQK